MLVLDRSAGSTAHSRFDKIKEYLRSGDLLVVNDTRVVPARLSGRKTTGGKVEFLVLDPYKPPELGMSEGYCCLTKASKPVRPGQIVEFAEGICAEIVCAPVDGKAQVRFSGASPIVDLLDRIGRTPFRPISSGKPKSPWKGILSAIRPSMRHIPARLRLPPAGLHFTKRF